MNIDPIFNKLLSSSAASSVSITVELRLGIHNGQWKHAAPIFTDEIDCLFSSSARPQVRVYSTCTFNVYV